MAKPKKDPKPDVVTFSPDTVASPPTTQAKSDDSPAVVSITGPDGRKRFAWRKDGVRPVINLDDFARNIHSALDGTPGADFADHTGPA